MRRLPRPALRPFIQSLWAMDETNAGPAPAARREHVVPSCFRNDGYRSIFNPNEMAVSENAVN